MAGSLCFTLKCIYCDIPIWDKLSVASSCLDESMFKCTLSFISTRVGLYDVYQVVNLFICILLDLYISLSYAYGQLLGKILTRYYKENKIM